MVQSLEAIKGGGGSIRVGTTGTISSLMTRELDSMKVPSQTHHNPSSSSSSSSFSLPNPRTRPTPRRSLDIEPTSSSNGSANFTSQQEVTIDIGGKKAKGSHGKSKRNSTHTIPMLIGSESDNDRTPVRAVKRGPTIVEVVDIKCGTSDINRAWTVPITTRLRKLGFSKLSDHTIA